MMPAFLSDLIGPSSFTWQISQKFNKLTWAKNRWSLGRTNDTARPCTDVPLEEEVIIKFRANHTSVARISKIVPSKVCGCDFLAGRNLQRRCQSGNVRLISCSSCLNATEEDRATVMLSQSYCPIRADLTFILLTNLKPGRTTGSQISVQSRILEVMWLWLFT